jgi:rhodanese-related sulfurtransferase
MKNSNLILNGLIELFLRNKIMKINLKTVLLLVGVTLILSGSYALGHTDVTPEQAHDLIGSTDNLIVVDVREPYEYCDAIGHIPGALNYPLSSGVLYDRYEELPIDNPILVVCRSGGRSNQAANFLDSQGFSMVYDMTGGMSSWIWETELCGQPEEKYSGGTGETNDPYQIATAEDLILLGETPEDYDKHFILTADIDLDPNLPDRKVFDRAVIAPDINDVGDGFQGATFTGVFDGNGYTITDLTISGRRYLGLFGQLGLGAMISNMGLEAIDVNGTSDYIGGLAGYNEGHITKNYSTGTVHGDDGIGGLLGDNFGYVTECYSTGLVKGDESVGGLVGENYGSITTSYSTCTVSGGEKVGGLSGYSSYSGQIIRCFSTGLVMGVEDVGGFVSGDGANITDCLWDMDTSGQDTSTGGEGKTTAEMQTAGTFLEAGWDFIGETENGTEDIWTICEGTNYPRFVWQIPVGDFVCPDGITIDDFSFFLDHWRDDNCDLSNDYCQGTDLDQSGKVDENDLDIFFEIWLAEKSVNN